MFPFEDNVILHIRNLKRSNKRLLEKIITSSKVSEYKINYKIAAFQYINNKYNKKKIMEIVSFTIVPQSTKKKRKEKDERPLQ